MDRQTIDNYIQQIQFHIAQLMQLIHQGLYDCQTTIEMIEQEKRRLEENNQALQDQVQDLERKLQMEHEPLIIEPETFVEPTF